MNQFYSITDQLQTGARVIRIDPVFYYGQLRTCHSSPLGVSGPTVCEAEAALPFVGTAGFFAPIAGLLHFAPLPIPAMVDTVLAGASIYAVANGMTQPISNRLFANTIKEVGNWLNNNPKEVIILMMYETDQDHHSDVQ